MALKATIFKCDLQIADMDRHYYADHALTIARHPSETDERMMMRVLAYALNAQEGLAFGGGLSTEDEPDLWLKDLTGAIRLWIEVGLPEEKLIRKARGRADQVVIYAYGGAKAALWWKGVAAGLARAERVRVVEVAPETSRELAALATRSMRLQCMIQDGEVSVTNGETLVQVGIAELSDA